MRERFLKEQDGFTLAEMMVTMMIMLIVLFALYGIFDMSLRIFSFSNNKVEAVEQAREGLGRMERELRMAYPYDRSASKNQIFIKSPADETADSILSTTPTTETDSITFGNDLDTGDGKLNKPSEVIRYALLEDAYNDPVTSLNVSVPCDPGDRCEVYRSNGNSLYRQLVGFVPAPKPSETPSYPGGLRFTYLDQNGNPTTVETAIKAVRIQIDVRVDKGNREGTQTLVTEVALRNRGV